MSGSSSEVVENDPNDPNDPEPGYHVNRRRVSALPA
jgi:hypothetical protein